MIIGVEYVGRLGNQLFTYAFMRMLMQHIPDKQITIVANFLRTRDNTNGVTDALKDFHVLPYHTKNENLVFSMGNWRQRIILSLYEVLFRASLSRNSVLIDRFLQRCLSHNGIYISDNTETIHEVKDVRTNQLFIRGFFQEKRHLDKIRPILMEELTPRFPIMDSNKSFYEILSQPNSVCVHVRRGDFLNDRNVKNFYVCTPEYYNQAINQICQRVENPSFFFFSDDIDWVKDNIVTGDIKCYYEPSGSPVWETFRMMYSCHHFIISNSTFSWWAQYLGRRDDKIVISPSNWYANPAWHSSLVDSAFITIDTNSLR